MPKETKSKNDGLARAAYFCHTSRPRRARGAAMVEFCLAVPFLVFIIALIFYFGSALKIQQEVKYGARHFAWRQALSVPTSPGPQEPIGTRQALVDLVGDQGAELAGVLFLERFPRGADGYSSARVSTTLELFENFNETVRATHVREGVPWARFQARPEDQIAVQFLADLDSKISEMGPLGDVIRKLYLSRW